MENRQQLTRNAGRMRLLPPLTLLAGILTTFLIWEQTSELTQEQVRTAFEFRVDESAQKLRNRINMYQQLLEDLAGVVYLNPDLSMKDFKDYVDRLQLDTRFPGTQGIGYLFMVAPENLPSFTRKMRAHLPDYTVRPSGNRGLYGPVVYLEPQTPSNRKVIGFDLYSEPKRHVSLSKAIDEGVTTISAPLVLVQDMDSQPVPGILVSTPVYTRDSEVDSVAARRQHILGMVAAPLRLSDLLKGVLGTTLSAQATQINIRLYDVTNAGERQLLFGGESQGVKESSRLVGSRHFEIGGRQWELICTATPEFDALTNQRWPPVVAALGVAISLLMFIIVMQMDNLRGRAEAIAARMTEALRKESERSQLLLRNASDGIHVLDADGNVLEASDSFCKMLGYSRQDVIGMNVTCWDVWLSRSDLSDVLRTQLGSQHNAIIKTKHKRSDGSIFDAEVSGLSHELDGKRVIFNSSRDVTDRIKMERQLALFQSLAEAIGDPVYVISPKQGFRHVYVNAAACRHFGKLRDELLRMAVPDWYPEFKDEERLAKLWETVKRKKIVLLETLQQVSDGHLAPVEVLANYLVHDDEEYIGGTFRDITSRRKDQEELVRAKEAAEAASRAKSAFLANMSHEIRTPITGVLGMVGLLKRTNTNEEQRAYLETLSSAAVSLLAILNDILDISKIEANKLTIEAIEFDWIETAANIVSVWRGTATTKGLSINLDNPGLPISKLIGDPVRFRQILHNLVSNAIKFTECGGISVRLSVSIKGANNVVVAVEVKDTGIGIGADEVVQLFQPFSQADMSNTRRFGGTGLGLAIVKRLVDLMGGEVAVESVVGQGSCFRVVLPFKMATATAQKSATALPIASFTIPTRQMRILLAEDNSINQLLVKAMLQKLGHVVVVTNNGIEAVKAVENNEFDVVLMDMQMPEMDGEEATRCIREMQPPKGQLVKAQKPVAFRLAPALLWHG